MTEQTQTFWVGTTNFIQSLSPTEELYREEPVAPHDSGWRILTKQDNQDFINNILNLERLTLNQVEALLPGVTQYSNYPVGTLIRITTTPKGENIFTP